MRVCSTQETLSCAKSALTDANWVFGLIVVITGLAATLSGGWVGDKLRTRYPGSYFLVAGWGMLFACHFLWQHWSCRFLRRGC